MAIPYLRSRYIIDPKPIGEGASGQVYKGRSISTLQPVAVKMLSKSNPFIDSEELNLPVAIAEREVKVLQNLSHENIITFIEVVKDTVDGQVFFCLVFELMDTDLATLSRQLKFKFDSVEVKHFMEQILKGLSYLRQKDVLHRDLKCANLLLNKNRRLKIADFGLARFLKEDWAALLGYDCSFLDEEMTFDVIGACYRPPEILKRSGKYDCGVDVWGAGCIFAEFLNGGKKLFPVTETDKEVEDRLAMIEKVCGSLRDMYSAYDSKAVDLLINMLKINPLERISALDALEHPYFSTAPLANEAEMMDQLLI